MSLKTPVSDGKKRPEWRSLVKSGNQQRSQNHFISNLSSPASNTLTANTQETGRSLYASSSHLICHSLLALNPSREFHCRRWCQPKTLLLLALICLWCHLFPSCSPVIGCWMQHLPWCRDEGKEEDTEELNRTHHPVHGGWHLEEKKEEKREGITLPVHEFIVVLFI